MTTTADPPREAGVSAGPGRAETRRQAVGRWCAAIVGAVLVFGAILLANGADPVEVLAAAWVNTVLSTGSVQEILIKAGPIALAALAVVVPSRAGLVNVGGEGQLVAGGIAAGGVGLATAGTLPGGLALVLMLLAGALAGVAWAGIAALLRLTVQVNEAASTLLLNYVALDLLLFLIYQPWKDPDGTGQPATAPLADAAQLPVFTGSRVWTRRPRPPSRPR